MHVWNGMTCWYGTAFLMMDKWCSCTWTVVVGKLYSGVTWRLKSPTPRLFFLQIFQAKPLSEPVMVSLPTHISVTRPHWVKAVDPENYDNRWWRLDMMTSSIGNIFRVTGPFHGEFTGEFPSQMPVTRSFDVFFDLRLNKRLCKQSRRRWFETLWRSLWRHCN